MLKSCIGKGSSKTIIPGECNWSFSKDKLVTSCHGVVIEGGRNFLVVKVFF